MTIVIPMAGLSQRFIDEGYILPKYMLYIENRSLFNLSVSSFHNHFNSCKFIFIARDVFDTPRFIENECSFLGISDYRIVILNKPTRGQAETVYLGLLESEIKDEEPITIFNIDTFHRAFKFPENMAFWDGYLEVFKGDGNNWSYAKTEHDSSTRVIQTAEKQNISPYCSTGLYYFKNKHLYVEGYENFVIQNNDKEIYIAPIYNLLIRQNREIHIHLIDRDDIVICGTPNELVAYIKFHYCK